MDGPFEEAPTPDAFDGRGVVPRRRWGDAAAARAPSPGLLDERRPSSGAWSQAGSSEDMEIGRGDFTPRDAGSLADVGEDHSLGDIGPPPSRSRSVSPLGAPSLGPEDAGPRYLEDREVRALTTAQARRELGLRGLSTGGAKPVLVERLLTAEARRRELRELGGDRVAGSLCLADAGKDADDFAPRKRSKTSPPPPAGGLPPDDESVLSAASVASDAIADHCPVCASWLRGDVYACRRGHIACGACKASLPEAGACPVCGVAMGAKRARHVELRLAGRDMPCRFDENGCDFSGTKAERRAHDDVCLHKKYRCPFAEGCPALLKVEAMRDHGVEAHRLRVTDRAPRERFVDHLVEMAEPRDRLNRMRKWKLLYAIDGDIYFLRVRRRKDPDLREMQMALSAYRIFRKDGDDGARPPLRVKVAIALEHRQAIAFTLNPEDALTTRKPRTPIPLDRVMDLPMHTAVQFPASMCDLTVGDLPGEPLKVDLTVEFHP